MNPKKPRPLTGKPAMRKHRAFKIGALDCETIPFEGSNPRDALDGKVDWVTWDHEDGYAGEVRNMRKFLTYLFEGQLDEKLLRKTIWYSHNGEYDWRYLIQAFEPYTAFFDIFASERSHGVLYQIEVKNKLGDRVTRFRDSMAFFPRSLKDFSATFSPEVPKGEIDFDKVIFDRHNPEHLQYARNDVLCLVVSIKSFDAFIYKHYRVHLSATASGTSYQAWLRTLPRAMEHWRLAPGTEAFMRKTYVGGMVQLNALHAYPYTNVSCYDINSSYPASMRLGVPVGKPRNTFHYREGKPGFYKVKFRSPGPDFPMPVMWHRSEGGQLCFPNNLTSLPIETYATSLEIDYALELGYDVQVIEGFWFPEGTHTLFNSYIDMCERLRAEYKGQPFEQVVKIMQNSLYGRFGMRPDGRQIKISYDDNGPGEGWALVLDPETGAVIPHVYFTEEERVAEYMQPHWSSWITARSRILLDRGTRALLRAGIPVLYRDTDSVYIQGEASGLLAVGDHYGEWKHEATYDEVKFHAPKFYTGLNGENLFGKCKGIVKVGKRRDVLAKLHNCEPFVDTYHRSNKVLAWERTKRLGEECTRTPTRAENVYSHIIENGMFKAKRL
jgi:DNA polymerase elongation subunit (family B)